MGNTMTHKFQNGRDMHFSVGAIIKKGDKYLVMDRAVVPLGYAFVAGHVDEGETPEQALKREVKEETDLTITSQKLVGEAVVDVVDCVKGVRVHHWYVYECEWSGELHPDSESRSMKWMSKEELKELKFEPSWEFWLKRLNLI